VSEAGVVLARGGARDGRTLTPREQRAIKAAPDEREISG